MHPLLRIGKTMQQPEGIHYAITFNINIGYYNIRIFLASQDMMTTMDEFWEFRYNRPLMGMFALGDIF